MAVLEAKFYAPGRRERVVSRGRLSERLRQARETKLSLVSAPAGFGKTTLLAELAADPGPSASVAWLSLDSTDSDPVEYWGYVFEAADRAVPGISEGAAASLQAGSVGLALTAFLNDLLTLSQDLLIILDDYHLVASPDVQDRMAFLVEHLPPRVHLVLGTRSDPPLPLARLRARGELLEIRAAELRFRSEEATAYLNGVMGLDLSPDDVEMLEGRTEGWVAALQLAALSMNGRADARAFLTGFAGDDRYVVDYLVEEVLSRQPPEVERFLLETSVLHRLTGPLCDAVTGQEGGRSRLDALDRQNLFLIPLDDRRQWFRYHHLFADVLRTRLADEGPEILAALHRRASSWYEAAGDRSEAIRHAIEGGDVERAADLVELSLPETRKARQEMTVLRWCEGLPKSVFEQRPVLAVGYVGALMSAGRFDGVDQLLGAAERWVDRTEREGGRARPVISDEVEMRRLPAALAMYRSALARFKGDHPESMARAREALAHAGEDDLVRRGGAHALLGLAAWSSGELETAYRAYAEGMSNFEAAGFEVDAVGGAINLADIRITQGRLGEALRLYERGLERASSPATMALRGVADMHVGIAAIAYQRGELQLAREHLREAQRLGGDFGMPRLPYRLRLGIAQIEHAEGHRDEARRLLQEAERYFVADFAPDVRPIPALTAMTAIAERRLDAAWAWARERGITAHDDVTYLTEYEHLVFAALLAGQGRRDDAPDLVEEAIALAQRLLDAAIAGGRTGSAIEILAVQALARNARRDPRAVDSLSRALRLAEPEGYVRVFIDLGPSMIPLLNLAVRQQDVAGYAGRLLRAFDLSQPRGVDGQPLIESLSERELDVLRLLQGDLDGVGIAGELSISVNTVRTHTKNIYAKLGVNDRRAAVRRAAELDLLAGR
jgi:LuxR family maltose regulon positive regulatory protein